MSVINTLIHVKDSSGVIHDVHPTTTIENVSGLQTALDGKVNTVSGKGLSSNDYTTAEKNKLSGIAAGAQVNSITGVKGNSESSYRTGNVNLTAANIGAAASSHTHNYAGSSTAGGAALSVLTKGEDIQLGTPSSLSNDSGDIVFLYGDGSEKMRIWVNDEYTYKVGPNVRMFDASGTKLFTGQLVLGDGTGLSTVSQNIANNTLYAHRSGKTVTVNGFVDNLSLTAGNGTLLGTINDEIGKPSQQIRAVCSVGPNAYSFGESAYIAIAPDGNVVATPKTYTGTGAVFFSVSYTI